jgi:hypothetical protein
LSRQGLAVTVAPPTAPLYAADAIFISYPRSDRREFAETVRDLAE